MTRREAKQAETLALELLKCAAIDYSRESSGGPVPLQAGAALRLAAKAYHHACSAFVDAVLAETKEERRAHEGVPPVMGRSTPR